MLYIDAADAYREAGLKDKSRPTLETGIEKARIGETRTVPIELIVNGQSVARQEINHFAKLMRNILNNSRKTPLTLPKVSALLATRWATYRSMPTSPARPSRRWATSAISPSPPVPIGRSTATGA